MTRRRSTPTNNAADELFSQQPTFTFFITIGVPVHNNTAPNEIPIFLATRTTENGRMEELSSQPFTSQFFGYIQELVETLRRKERVKKGLSRHKAFICKKEMVGSECPICLDSFKKKQLIRRLDCDHKFHMKCVDKWLVLGNSNCPICRKEPFSKEKCCK